MSITETDKLASSVAVTSLGTRNSTFTLPNGSPFYYNWVFVSLFTNYGNIPAGTVSGQVAKVNSVKIGTLDLALIESPTVSGASYSPTLYGIPLNSGNFGSASSTITVNWQNITSATMTLQVCISVFTGGDVTNSSGFAAFRPTTAGATGNGEFDSAGGNTFGATGAIASSGLVTWSNSTGITTNYDVSYQPFVATFFTSLSSGLNLTRQIGFLGAGVDSSGNVTTYAQPTGSIQLTSSSTGLPTSGKCVVHSTNGNFVISYTGTTTSPYSTLSGCTTTAPSGTTLNGGEFLLFQANSTNTVTTVLASSSTTSGVLRGVVTGDVATSSGVIQQSVTGGTVTGRLDLHVGKVTEQSQYGGYNNQLRQYSIPAYGHLRIGGSNASNGGGFIYFLVPRYRTMSRYVQPTRVFVAKTTKFINKTRISSVARVHSLAILSQRALKRSVAASRVWSRALAKALSKNATASRTVAATLTRNVHFTRNVSANVTYVVGSSRIRNFVRTAKAGTVAAAKYLFHVVIASQAGQVTVDYTTATVLGGKTTASVETSIKTGTVGTNVGVKGQV